MSDTPAPLWTPVELAKFLGYSPRSIVAMASRSPDKLPPRVQALSQLRWVPSVCQAWVEKQSGPIKSKGGRPRSS